MQNEREGGFQPEFTAANQQEKRFPVWLPERSPAEMRMGPSPLSEIRPAPGHQEEPAPPPLREIQEQEHPEPEKGDSRDHPKIIVVYDGTLATKLRWDHQALGAIERAASLRSRVVIRTGREVLRPQAVGLSLGDILAKNGFRNILDAFSRNADSELQNVRATFREDKAEIIINDQLISGRLRDRRGHFDGNEFTRIVDAGIRRGLSEIIVKEKLVQFGLATFYDGMTIFFQSIPVGFTLGGGYLMQRFGPEFFTRDSSQFLTVLGLLWLLHGGIYTATMALRQYYGTLKFFQSAAPYIKDWGDLNPLRHIKDMGAGALRSGWPQPVVGLRDAR